MDNLGLHGLNATLVCFIFDDTLFVFCNLVQTVDFVGADSS